MRSDPCGRVALGAVLTLLLAGCASTPVMMPPPVVVSERLVQPFDRVPESERRSDLDIFFATDRNPVDVAACRYGDERGDVLRLGVATVRFGDPGWGFEELVERSVTGQKVELECGGAEEFGRLWSTISPADRERYEVARSSRSAGDPIRAPAMRFAESVDAQLERAGIPDIYIFVPGYNTTFHETVERFAQFSHFARGSGVFLAYSWPTRLSFLSYVEDTQKGALSVRNLRELILLLGRETQVRRIHLIGYSAGAQILSEALLQLRLMHPDAEPGSLAAELRIGRLFFPAPDLDLMYARNLELDRWQDVAEKIAVYVSHDDLGVWASARFIFKAPRLGYPDRHLNDADIENLRDARGAHFVDPAQAKKSGGGGDFFGHAYWYANPWVSTDALLFLVFGLDPAERGLVRSEDGTRWLFPEDYPERLRGVVESLREHEAEN